MAWPNFHELRKRRAADAGGQQDEPAAEDAIGVLNYPGAEPVAGQEQAAGPASGDADPEPEPSVDEQPPAADEQPAGE